MWHKNGSTLHRPTLASLLKSQTRASQSTSSSSTTSSSSSSTLIKTRANLAKTKPRQSKLGSIDTAPARPKLMSMRYNEQDEANQDVEHFDIDREFRIKLFNSMMSQDMQTQTCEPPKPSSSPNQTARPKSSLCSASCKSLNSLVDIKEAESQAFQKCVSEFNLDSLNADEPEDDKTTDYGLLLHTLYRSLSIQYDQDQLCGRKLKDKSKSVWNLSSTSTSQTSRGTKRKRASLKSSRVLVPYKPMQTVARVRDVSSGGANYHVELPTTASDYHDSSTVRSTTTGVTSSIRDVSYMLASTDGAIESDNRLGSSLRMITPVLSGVARFKSHRHHRLRLSAHAHRSHRKHRTKRVRLSSAGLVASRKSSSTSTCASTIVSGMNTKTSSSSSSASSRHLDSLGRRFAQMSFSSQQSVTTSVKGPAKMQASKSSSRAPSTASSKQSSKTNQDGEANSFRDRFQSLLRHPSFLHPKQSLDAAHHRPEYLLQEIDEHRAGVNCLELSEDQSLLVSGGEDGVLRLWSTFSMPCECISILVGHLDYITCCTIYKYLIVSGSADTTLKIWSISDGNCLTTLRGHTGFIVRCVCYGPLLLSSSFDSTVRIWSLTEELTIQLFDSDRQSIFARDEEDDDDDYDDAFSLNDDQLNNVQLSNLLKRKTNRQADIVSERKLQFEFGQCFKVLQGHARSVTRVAVVQFDPENKLERGIIHELNNIVITASVDGTARTWSLATGELRHILAGHTGPINCVEVDPKDPQMVYTAGSDHDIKCWDIITGELLRSLKGHQGAILCLMAQNRILYSGSADTTVRAWAMEFGQNTRTFYGSSSSVTVLQYADGILFTGSNDHIARLYDANAAVLKRSLLGHDNSISSMRVVPGRLFTASFDGKILVWDSSDLVLAKNKEDNKPESGKDAKMKKNESSSAIGQSLVSSIGFLLGGDPGNHQRNRLKELYELYPGLDRRFSVAEIEHHQALQTAFRRVLRKRALLASNKKPSMFSLRSLLGVPSGVDHLSKLWRGSTKTKTTNKTHKQDVAPFMILDGSNQLDDQDSEAVRRAIASLEPYIRTFN